MKPKKIRARVSRPKSPKTTQTKPGLFLIEPSLGALAVWLVGWADLVGQEAETQLHPNQSKGLIH
jgi:hypothetical protein